MHKRLNPVFRNIGFITLVLSVWVFVYAFLPGLGDELKAKEPVMNYDTSAVMDTSDFPAIDMDVPAGFETASFGLG